MLWFIWWQTWRFWNSSSPESWQDLQPSCDGKDSYQEIYQDPWSWIELYATNTSCLSWLHDLSLSRVFSKADFSSGFWHVPLDEQSFMLTPFQTCFGCYRWLWLPSGLSVSSKIFQKKLVDALEGLPDIICNCRWHLYILIGWRRPRSMHRWIPDPTQRNEYKAKSWQTATSHEQDQMTSENKRFQTDPGKVRAIWDIQAPQNVANWDLSITSWRAFVISQKPQHLWDTCQRKTSHG